MQGLAQPLKTIDSLLEYDDRDYKADFRDFD